MATPGVRGEVWGVDSPRAGRVRWIRAAGAALLGLLVVGGVASAIAAAEYPGGTWMDSSTVGHSFWGNFLCDIARTPALDGRPHPGAPWGRVAEWALVLALGLFFVLAPALVDPPSIRKSIRVLGLVAAISLALVPVTSGGPHAMVLLLGAGPGFIGTLRLLSGFRRRPVLHLLGRVSLVLAVLELGLFLGFSERFGVRRVPLAVPLVQRLALLAAVAWMAGCALTALLAPQEVEVAGASPPGSPRAT